MPKQTESRRLRTSKVRSHPKKLVTNQVDKMKPSIIRLNLPDNLRPMSTKNTNGIQVDRRIDDEEFHADAVDLEAVRQTSDQMIDRTKIEVVTIRLKKTTTREAMIERENVTDIANRNDRNHIELIITETAEVETTTPADIRIEMTIRRKYHIENIEIAIVFINDDDEVHHVIDIKIITGKKPGKILLINSFSTVKMDTTV